VEVKRDRVMRDLGWSAGVMVVEGMMGVMELVEIYVKCWPE
jgi:hypothetical protein